MHAVGKLGGAYIPLPRVTSKINAILGAEAAPATRYGGEAWLKGLTRGLGERTLDKEKNGRYCQHDRGNCEFLSSRLSQNPETNYSRDARHHPGARKVERAAIGAHIASH